MTWVVDQASLGTPVSESAYGDTAIDFVTNVDVAAGGWAFLLVRWFFTDTLNAPTDDGPGLTWDVVQTNPGGGDARLAIVRAYCPSGLASGTTISLAWSSGDVGNKVVHGLSFTGGDASSFDAAVTAASGTSGSWSLPYTTGTDGELVLGFVVSGTGASNTETSGTEVLDNQVLGSNDIGQYAEQATAGSGSLAGNLSFSDDWWAIGVKMLVAAGSELTLDLGKVDSSEVVQGIDLIPTLVLELGKVPQPVPPGGGVYPGDDPPDIVYGVDLALDAGLTLDLGDIPGAGVVNGIDLAAAGPLALSLGDIAAAGVVHGVDLTASGPLALSLGDIPSGGVVNGIDLALTSGLTLDLGAIPAASAAHGIDLSAAGALALSLGDIPSSEVVNGIDLAVAGPLTLSLGDIPSSLAVRGVDLAGAVLTLSLGDIASGEVVHGIDLSQSGPLTLSLGDIPSVLAVQGLDLSQSGPVALALGRIVSAAAAQGIDLAIFTAPPLVLRVTVEFESGVGRIEYENGVRLSEYSDGMRSVEF